LAYHASPALLFLIEELARIGRRVADRIGGRSRKLFSTLGCRTASAAPATIMPASAGEVPAGPGAGVNARRPKIFHMLRSLLSAASPQP
jgi:hypothetical protein